MIYHDMAEHVEEFRPGFVLYSGNMSGGKTDQMISDLQRAKVAGRRVQAFKVSWDDRYEDGFITANNGQKKFPAISVPDFGGLINRLDPELEVLGIDELQFWEDRTIEFIKEHRDLMKIIGTGLQYDFRGNPFPLRSQKGKEFDSKRHIGELMSLAIKDEKCWPICTHKEGERVCGMPAFYVQRWNALGKLSLSGEPTLGVGKVVRDEAEGQEQFRQGNCAYAVRCAEHYVNPIGK